MVQGVLDGQNSPEELVELLDQVGAALESQREQFQEALRQEDDEVQQILRPEVMAVNQSLEDYERVLQGCGAYLQGFDKAYLDDTLLNLPLAVDRLNLDFLRYHEAVLAQRGPTTHAGINQLLSVPEEGEELDALAQMEVGKIEAALEYLAKAPSHALTELLTRFHQDYLAALGAQLSMDEWQEELYKVGMHYARLDVDALARRFSDGPTRLPGLNLVLASAWLASQDEVEPEVCIYLLADLKGQLDASEDSAALKALKSTLVELEAWIEQPQPDVLPPLLEKLQEQAARV